MGMIRTACVGGLAVLLAISIVLGLANAAYAFGYRDTGLDPNDRGSKRPDIRSTTRKVWAAPNGHRYLTVTLRTYEDLPSWWTAAIALDSRRGSLRDFRMETWNNGADGHGCVIDTSAGAFRQHG